MERTPTQTAIVATLLVAGAMALALTRHVDWAMLAATALIALFVTARRGWPAFLLVATLLAGALIAYFWFWLVPRAN